MVFGVKLSIGPEKNFTGTDLLQYVESLLKTTKLKQRRQSVSEYPDYSWLKSRDVNTKSDLSFNLDRYRAVILKMPPECCAAIAVKLDNYAEGANVASQDIAGMFKQLLEEQRSIQMMENSAKDEGKKMEAKVRMRRRSMISSILN